MLATLLGLFHSSISAQINIKAGYNFSLVSDPGLDQVIGTFSATQDYTKSFEKLSWMHGFEGGLRLKSDVHALELTYQGDYRRLKAEGQLVGAPDPYTDKINLAIHSGGIGYQVAGDVFGVGTDFQYQWYITKVTLANEVDVFKDVQTMMALKFYLMFTLKGSNGIDAALQPYYVLPFETYDIDPISQYLNQQDGPEVRKWDHFGLTILFYNGGK